MRSAPRDRRPGGSHLEVGAAQVRLEEDCTLQVGIGEHRALEGCSFEINIPGGDGREVRPIQTRMSKATPVEQRARQVGAREQRAGKIRRHEVRETQIGRAEVFTGQLGGHEGPFLYPGFGSGLGVSRDHRIAA